MSIADWRRERISKPVLGFFRKVMPPISDTEQEALEAGDIWWDAELFSGDPDWSMLLGTAARAAARIVSAARCPCAASIR